MPIQFGQPPTDLGSILGGLGTGQQGGGGLMELLNLLFRGGAGRGPLMPGITGGRTMAGVRRPQPVIPGAVEIEGPGGKGGIPGGPTTIDPIANLLEGGPVPGRPDLFRPGVGPVGGPIITDQNAPFSGPPHNVPDPLSTPGIPGPQPTGGPGSRWWERPGGFSFRPRPTRPFTPRPIIPGARPFDPGPGGFPFAPRPDGTIGGFLDLIKGKLFGPGGGDSVRPIFNPVGPGGAITRGDEGGFTGGISFAPGTGPKERAAAEGALSPPARRFRGGIAFAPGTGAKERSAASSSLGKILGGF